MNLESEYKRLTPAHLSFCSWKPNNTEAEKNGIRVQKTNDEIVGEQIVADKKLVFGDKLLQELPFIMQISDDYKSTNCAFCFNDLKGAKKVCQNRQCKWDFVYCSGKCQRQHWMIEHKWLCNFSKLLDTDKDVLFAFHGYIASRSAGEYIIPGLVSNINSHKPEDIEAFREKINRSKLKKAFFLSDGVVESMVIISAQIRCNAFAVKGYISYKDGDIEHVKHAVLGRAIYLSASKFNHSCNPNALAEFGCCRIGTMLNIHLTKGPKSVGSELTISYGPLFSRAEKKERKKELKEKYFFNCNCETCQLDYEPVTSIYKCQDCLSTFSRSETQCRRCWKIINWKSIMTDLGETKRLLKLAKQNNDLRLFQKAKIILDRIYIHESLPIGEYYDQLGETHAMLDNISMTVECLRNSVKIVGCVFGDDSPEVASELLNFVFYLYSK
ncbi:hypothetical protein BY458DRAFT_439704 [Sporodiniella umbellata]|nr:hypothetical protein BY458DRAFT_439704 [Sporodiniella umbellata]